MQINLIQFLRRAARLNAMPIPNTPATHILV